MNPSPVQVSLTGSIVFPLSFRSHPPTRWYLMTHPSMSWSSASLCSALTVSPPVSLGLPFYVVLYILAAYFKCNNQHGEAEKSFVLMSELCTHLILSWKFYFILFFPSLVPFCVMQPEAITMDRKIDTIMQTSASASARLISFTTKLCNFREGKKLLVFVVQFFSGQQLWLKITSFFWSKKLVVRSKKLGHVDTTNQRNNGRCLMA